MKVLIIGGNGMLGHKLVQQLSTELDVWCTVRRPYSSVEKYGLFRRERVLDEIHAEKIKDLERAFETVQPDVVINAVGIIKQLPNSKDVIETLQINAILPHHLNQLAQRYECRLICVSTDCVFNGEKGMYGEDDIPDAYDLYGRSKNLGEPTGGNCLTIRTSIIGRELASAHSMVEWFLSNRGRSVNGYVNAIYSGFPTVVFADIIAKLLIEHSGLKGLYHVSSDPINKFELLRMINEQYGSAISVEPFEDFSIDRSLDSSRFRSATGFRPTPWGEMVERMAADPTPYDTFGK